MARAKAKVKGPKVGDRTPKAPGFRVSDPRVLFPGPTQPKVARAAAGTFVTRGPRVTGPCQHWPNLPRFVELRLMTHLLFPLHSVL